MKAREEDTTGRSPGRRKRRRDWRGPRRLLGCRVPLDVASAIEREAQRCQLTVAEVMATTLTQQFAPGSERKGAPPRCPQNAPPLRDDTWLQ
jgi:hypothetical protein